MLERKDNPLLFWAGEQFVGACPNIKPLVEAVRALPGLADWAPGGHTMQVWRLLVLGMILRRIDDPSFLPLLEKMSESLRRDANFARDDEAELIAAAVVRPWCIRVAYIPRVDEGRSPDLVATVPSGDIEIEVTTASRKIEQDQRNKVASDLQQKLREIPLDRHIDVHFVDTLTGDEERAIVEWASKLRVGETAEVEDRWHVRVSPPNAGVMVVGSASPPTWFPQQHATPASFSASFSAGAQTARLASAQARWGLSTKSYLNPLSKKAERHQGSNRVPFVIAMDVTQLPGALGWYEDALKGYWELWPHVSAVLLFSGPAWAGDVLTLSYKFMANPVSGLKLPETWSSGKWDERLN